MFDKTVGKKKDNYLLWALIYTVAFWIPTWNAYAANGTYQAFVELKSITDWDLLFTKPPFYFLLGRFADLIGGKFFAEIVLSFASGAAGFGVIYLLDKVGQRKLATMYAFIPLAFFEVIHQPTGFLLLLSYLAIKKGHTFLGGMVAGVATFVHFSSLPFLAFILISESLKDGGKAKNLAGGMITFISALFLLGYNTILYGLNVMRLNAKYITKYVENPLKERLFGVSDYIILTGPISILFTKSAYSGNSEMRLMSAILILTVLFTPTIELARYFVAYIPLLLYLCKDKITNYLLEAQGTYYAFMFVLLRFYG
ncbi:hypothetical protein HY989_00940 [Candidatus Micrarchaeota archaeon]|nr:hypothetical protein [Candidatus Micrarchaeota archaeon]